MVVCGKKARYIKILVSSSKVRAFLKLGAIICILGFIFNFYYADSWSRVQIAQVGLPTTKYLVKLNLTTQPESLTKPATPRPLTPWEVMQGRRDLVAKVCQNGTGHTKNITFERPILSRKHNFLYCPVEKVASTFWKRFTYQLENTSPMRSPFEVSVQRTFSSMGGKFKIIAKNKADREKVLNYTKLLYVRDPYSRIFSAYVDKLLAPNPVYWKNWGSPAIKKFRSGHDVGGPPPCGHDVTFSEFVSYVLSDLAKRDAHIMPAYLLCSPCSMNYTFIGKMETFQDDLGQVLSALNIDEKQLSMEKMANDTLKDAIDDSVHDAFTQLWLKNTLKCINKEGVARRIWRKLQIRGVVSWRQNFNIAPNKIQTMSGQEFTQILKAALQHSDKNELKLQKRQAYLEAYSTLSISQHNQILKVFGPDFELFDYKEESEKLFHKLRSGLTETGVFDWRKNWDLGGVVSK